MVHAVHIYYQLPKKYQQSKIIMKEFCFSSYTRNPRINCLVIAIGVCVLNKSACRNFKPPYSSKA